MLCLEFICKPRAVFRKDYHNKVIRVGTSTFGVSFRGCMGCPVCVHACVRVLSGLLFFYTLR